MTDHEQQIREAAEAIFHGADEEDGDYAVDRIAAILRDYWPIGHRIHDTEARLIDGLRERVRVLEMRVNDLEAGA